MAGTESEEIEMNATIVKLTNRSRFILRVAGATTSDYPWASGYSEYGGTFHSLKRQLRQISEDHGGNAITAWYYHGELLNKSELASHFGYLWAQI